VTGRAPRQGARSSNGEGAPRHAEREGLIHSYGATAATNPMETAMTWTNRITIAATLIGGALALMTYAQTAHLLGPFA
jgi:hypothetical protein